MDLIVADGLESFELHVAALQLPFVVLFEQQRASEAHDRGIVGKDADDVGPPFDFGIEPFEGIRRGDLLAVRFGEVHERENIVFCVIEILFELGKFLTELCSDSPPLLMRAFRRFLREYRVDHRDDHLALTLAGVGERVAHEVHAAALPRGCDYFRNRRFESQMRIGNDQLHAAQAATREAAEKLRPERFGFTRTNRKTEDFP